MVASLGAMLSIHRPTPCVVPGAIGQKRRESTIRKPRGKLMPTVVNGHLPNEFKAKWPEQKPQRINQPEFWQLFFSLTMYYWIYISDELLDVHNSDVCLIWWNPVVTIFFVEITVRTQVRNERRDLRLISWCTLSKVVCIPVSTTPHIHTTKMLKKLVNNALKQSLNVNHWSRSVKLTKLISINNF